MASLEMLYRVIAKDGASPAFKSVGESAKLLQRTVEEANAKIIASQRALAEQTVVAMSRIERAELKAAAASHKHAKARREAMMRVGATSALILAAVAAESIKMAANFQQSTNILVTSAGESAGALKMVRAGILSIASETGTKWQDLVDGMYRIEKAGFRGADGLHILKAAAQAAREEGTSLEVVTGSLTSALLDYHLPASAAVMVTNEMKTAAGEAKATFGEFDKGLGTILYQASSLHISFADISGTLAEMTQHGLSAERSSDQLSNAMRNLTHANGPAQKMMAQMGIDSMDVAMKLGDGPGGRGLAGTMQYLSDVVLKHMGPAGTVLLSTMNASKIAAHDADVMFNALPDAAKKVAQAYKDGHLSSKEWILSTGHLDAAQASLARQWAIGENRAKGFQQTLRSGLSQNQTYNAMMQTMTGGANGLSVALNTTGQNAGDTNERIKRVGDSAVGAGKDVNGWASTLGLSNVQFDRFKQSIDGLMIALGTTLLPAVTAVFGFLADHTSAVRILAEVIGGVLVAATVAWGIALFSTGVGEVVLAITALGVGLIELVTHFRQVTDFLHGPWGTAISVAVAVMLPIIGLPMLLIGHWKEVSKFFVWLWHNVSDSAQSLWHAAGGFFSRMWHDVSGFAERIWHDVTGFFARIAHDVMGPLRAIAGFIGDHWRLLLTIVTAGAGLVLVVIIDHWKQIMGFTSRLRDAVNGFVSRMWHDVTGFFQSGADKATSTTSSLRDTVNTFVSRMWHDVAGFVSNLWHDVTGFFGRGRDDVAGIMRPFVTAISDVWHRIYSATMGVVQPLWHDVTGFFGRMKDGVLGIFRQLASGIGSIWNSVRELVAGPIRWVIENPYDKGIVPLIHGIGGVLHESSMSNLAPLHFATGGVIPGSHNRDTVPFFGTPGEVVVPKSAVAAAGGAGSLMRALGFGGGGGAGGHYGVGGVIHGIGSAVAGAAGDAAHVVAHPLDALKDIGHMVLGALGATAGPIIHGLESTADSILGGMGGVGHDMALLVHVIGDKLLSFVSGKDSAAAAAAKATGGGGSYGGAPGAAGGAGRWAGVVAQALGMLSQPLAMIPGVLSLINSESGGNPNAINLWDSNAKAGYPSRGLMQTIPGTFEANRSMSLPDNIVDPLANIYAGINYALRNYGPGMLLAGGRHSSGGGYLGYATGGMPPVGVPYKVGENGPETRIDFAPGRILSHKDSMELGARRSGPLVHVENVSSTVDLSLWAQQAAFLESAGHFG